MDALVLGGGGPAGVAWTGALVQGLASAGLAVADVDVVLGTSAGSVVGAWLTTQPEGLGALPERMIRRAAWHVGNSRSGYGDKTLLSRLTARSTTDSALSVAQAAVAAIPPISTDEAEELWQATLPEGAWSDRLRVVSVDATTGLPRVWSSQDDITVAVAVACSTAAPGVAPPVAVAGSVFVDGGVRSGTNADLVAELGTADVPGRVLVLAPIPSDALAREEAVLVARGYRVRVIVADRFYESPIDLLTPSFVDAGATAGAKQAQNVADDLLAWWRG